jgi:hypothetical protein
MARDPCLGIILPEVNTHFLLQISKVSFPEAKTATFTSLSLLQYLPLSSGL